MARKVNTTEAPIVLIVDDDVSMRWSTGRFVRSLGMRAEPFASLNICYQRRGRPGSAFRVRGFLCKPVGKDALRHVIHMALKTVK